MRLSRFMSTLLIKISYLPVIINHQMIPHENGTKYLGISLNVGMHWKVHVNEKRTIKKI